MAGGMPSRLDPAVAADHRPRDRDHLHEQQLIPGVPATTRATSHTVTTDGRIPAVATACLNHANSLSPWH
jgi:hypothetical protein